MKEKRYCLRLIVYMVLGAIFEAIGISAILPLISILANSSFLEEYPYIKEIVSVINITNHIQFILLISWSLISLYIFKNAYMIWLTKRQVKFSVNQQIIFAKKLMKLYLGKPYLEHLERNSSVLLRDIQTSLNLIFTRMLVGTFSLITEMITAFVIWMMLICIDLFMATVVAVVLTVMIYMTIIAVRKKLKEQGNVQNHYSAQYTKWLNQGLGAIKETKVLRKENYFLEKFSHSYQCYGEAQMYYAVTAQLPRFFIEAMVTIGLLILIIAKLSLGIPPQEIVPLLGVLALAAFRLMPCANRIINFSNEIKYIMPTFDALYQDLLAAKRMGKELKVADRFADSSEICFLRNISIENLQFRYPKGTEEVLQQVSFDIPKGSFMGIVGQSGAGKTTFVDILLGLLEPTDGKILVDGQDIFRNIRGWQAKLSYVPQSIYLIDGSIQENIAMGVDDQDVDLVRIEKVLRMAELYDFIQKLPEGIATTVGECGAKLSGGQRQRIGIARALYQEPEVLILDEATSALDNETEKNITDTILKLKGQITIIAIAHRMSTLENCDFKIQFEGGEASIILNELYENWM